MVTTWVTSRFWRLKDRIFAGIESGPDSNQELEDSAPNLFINITSVSVPCLIVTGLHYVRLGGLQSACQSEQEGGASLPAAFLRTSDSFDRLLCSITRLPCSLPPVCLTLLFLLFPGGFSSPFGALRQGSSLTPAKSLIQG